MSNNERRSSFSKLRSLASDFFDRSQFKTDVVPKLLQTQDEKEEDLLNAMKGLQATSTAESNGRLSSETFDPSHPNFGEGFLQFVQLLRRERSPSTAGAIPEFQEVINQNPEQVDEFLKTFCSTSM